MGDVVAPGASARVRQGMRGAEPVARIRGRERNSRTYVNSCRRARSGPGADQQECDVVVRLRAQRAEEAVTGPLQAGPRVLHEAGQQGEAGVDRLSAVLDQPVGVQGEQGARGELQFHGAELHAAHPQRHAAGHVTSFAPPSAPASTGGR
ncbi:hypothetical protein SAFG77S_04920 [Streptomyces afghaniensis]